MGRRIPFAFLNKMQETFKESGMAESVKQAKTQSLNADYQAFRNDIRDLVVKYNSPNADPVTRRNLGYAPKKAWSVHERANFQIACWNDDLRCQCKFQFCGSGFSATT